MKRLFMMLICGALLALAACAKTVSKSPIDARYTPAQERIVTSYDYALDILGDSTFKLMPNVHTVHIPESYEVLYEIVYDNGNARQEWEIVDFTTYKRTCESIGKDGAE